MGDILTQAASDLVIVPANKKRPGGRFLKNAAGLLLHVIQRACISLELEGALQRGFGS
jgi:hypothetical protein